jgi:hypothetical protein
MKESGVGCRGGGGSLEICECGTWRRARRVVGDGGPVARAANSSPLSPGHGGKMDEHGGHG